MRIRAYPFVVAVGVLGGCSYEAVPPPADVAELLPEVIEAPIPGRFAYLIDEASLERMRATDTIRGFVCGTDTIPLNAQASLRDAVAGSLSRVFDAVQPAPAVLNAPAVRRAGLDGLIVVSVEDFRPEVRFHQNLLSSPDADAKADLALVVEITGPDGPILQSRVSGGQSLNYPSGGCAGGATALAEATARAIRLALDRLNRQLIDSQPLRMAARHSPPAVAANPSTPPRDITGNAFETKP